VWTTPKILGVRRNLVDPASIHMLLSRTKPCKCETTHSPACSNRQSVDGSLNSVITGPTRKTYGSRSPIGREIKDGGGGV